MHGGSEQGVSKTMGAPKREGAKHAQSWVQRGRQQTCLGLVLLAAYAGDGSTFTSSIHGRAFSPRMHAQPLQSMLDDTLRSRKSWRS